MGNVVGMSETILLCVLCCHYEIVYIIIFLTNPLSFLLTYYLKSYYGHGTFLGQF